MRKSDLARGLLWMLPVITSGVLVFADGNPATEAVPRVMGYQGYLDMGGVPLDAPVTLEFAMYPDITSTTSIYRQCIATTPHGGRFSVVLGPSGFSGGDGVGCDDAATTLASVISDANDLHIGVTIIDPQNGRVALQGRQRVLPVPYALWAVEGTNFRVNGTLTAAGNATVGGSLGVAGSTTVGGNLAVTGNVSGNEVNANVIKSGAFIPPHANWPQYGSGAGGAAIYNDATGEKKLMIVGNNVGGGARRVGLWDDVQVAGNLGVGGNFAAGGQIAANTLRARSCWWKGVGKDSYADSQMHEAYCDEGAYMRGWRCYASTYLDGSCDVLCCWP